MRRLICTFFDHEWIAAVTKSGKFYEVCKRCEISRLTPFADKSQGNPWMKRLALFLITFVVALAVILVSTGGLNEGTNHPVAYVPPTSSITPEGARQAIRPPTFSFAPNAIHIDAKGLALIEQFEGYSQCAYWDPYGRVYTAGFGQTRGIYKGFCFASRAAAEANLRYSVINEYEWAVHAMGVNFNQNQIDALDSFAYNLGAGIFTGQLRYDFTSHNFAAATALMLQYDHSGGVVLPGLYTRRHEEVNLFNTPVANRKGELYALYKTREELRADRLRHHCAEPPKYGGGRYHKICARWTADGKSVNARIAKLHGKGVY